MRTALRTRTWFLAMYVVLSLHFRATTRAQWRTRRPRTRMPGDISGRSATSAVYAAATAVPIDQYLMLRHVVPSGYSYSGTSFLKWLSFVLPPALVDGRCQQELT